MPTGTSLDTIPRKKISTAVRAGLSFLFVGAFAFESPVFAQDTDDTESDDANEASSDSEDAPLVEEVLVTGHRQGLESAQDLKQLSDVLVDSVTAEDIGALPDRSVTETLQRMPGVAINRFAAGRDPDHFSVEGSGVVVRGLTYVRSEINGRDSFTANNGRGLSFADVPPELLAGVDVFKSPSADRIEGGIAGTVNLRTRKPFDQNENIFAFSAEGNYGDFAKESSPTYSALGSWRWENSAGEFGFLGSLVKSNIRARGDRFQVSNFAERTLYSTGDVIPTGAEGETAVQQVFFPRGAVLGTQEFDRERRGYAAAFQWRSPDRSMEATAEFLRSDSREAWSEHVVEIATDNVASNGDSRAVAGTSFTFDNSNVFDSGYITGPSGWRDDQWSGDPRTPVLGLQSNNIRRDVKQKFVTDDLSLNFVWHASDTLAINFDYQHVDSTVDNLDATLWTSTFQNARIDLNGSSVPVVEFTPPVLCTEAPSNSCPTYFTQGHDSFIDPYNSFYRSAMDHIEASEGTSDSYRVDFSKLLPEHDWIDGIAFGYRHADRDQVARFSTYNWGVLSEIWAQGGPVWLDDPIASNGGQPLMGYAPFYFDDFFSGSANNPLGNSGRLFYADNIAENYDDYVNYASQVLGEWRPGNGWTPLANRPGVIAGTPFLPGEINPVREKNDALYFTLKFNNELANGWNLSGNVGLRYTETNRKASGFQQFPFVVFSTEEECNAPLDPGQSRSPFCSLDPEVREQARAFNNGALTPITTNFDYDYVLPSVNLKLAADNGWQYRAAYFKGVSAPDFGLTRAYFDIRLQTNQEDIEAGNGRPVARPSVGNPFLEPVESDNFDLTAEWYFADVGQLSFALFYKRLKGIRTNTIERQEFTNNGATFEAIVSTATNSPETGKIKGLEIAYQQTYDFLGGWMSGLGLSANYTWVDSSNVPQSTLSETDPDVAAGQQSTVDISLLPLEGLSEHTFNISPFYEWGNWSARLAYSWRDEFLLTIRDVIVPFQPIVNEATGQLDASLFYQINDNLKVGFQGVNLTQEIIKTSAIISDDLQTAPRSWYISDRRYSFILRGRF